VRRIMRQCRLVASIAGPTLHVRSAAGMPDKASRTLPPALLALKQVHPSARLVTVPTSSSHCRRSVEWRATSRIDVALVLPAPSETCRSTISNLQRRHDPTTQQATETTASISQADSDSDLEISVRSVAAAWIQRVADREVLVRHVHGKSGTGFIDAEAMPSLTTASIAGASRDWNAELETLHKSLEPIDDVSFRCQLSIAEVPVNPSSLSRRSTLHPADSDATCPSPTSPMFVVTVVVSTCWTTTADVSRSLTMLPKPTISSALASCVAILPALATDLTRDSRIGPPPAPPEPEGDLDDGSVRDIIRAHLDPCTRRSHTPRVVAVRPVSMPDFHRLLWAGEAALDGAPDCDVGAEIELAASDKRNTSNLEGLRLKLLQILASSGNSAAMATASALCTPSIVTSKSIVELCETAVGISEACRERVPWVFPLAWHPKNNPKFAAALIVGASPTARASALHVHFPWISEGMLSVRHSVNSGRDAASDAKSVGNTPPSARVNGPNRFIARAIKPLEFHIRVRAIDHRRIVSALDRSIPVDLLWPYQLGAMALAFGPWTTRFRDIASLPPSVSRNGFPFEGVEWSCRGRQCDLSLLRHNCNVTVEAASSDVHLLSRAVGELWKGIGAGKVVGPLQREPNDGVIDHPGINVTPLSLTIRTPVGTPRGWTEGSRDHSPTQRDLFVEGLSIADTTLPPLYLGTERSVAEVTDDDARPHVDTDQLPFLVWNYGVGLRNVPCATSRGRAHQPSALSPHVPASSTSRVHHVAEPKAFVPPPPPSQPASKVTRSLCMAASRERGFTMQEMDLPADGRGIFHDLMRRASLRLDVTTTSYTICNASKSVQFIVDTKAEDVPAASSVLRLLRYSARAVNQRCCSTALNDVMAARHRCRFRYGTPKTAVTLLADTLFIRYFGTFPEIEILSSTHGFEAKAYVRLTTDVLEERPCSVFIAAATASTKLGAKQKAAIAALMTLFPGPWCTFQLHGAIHDTDIAWLLADDEGAVATSTPNTAASSHVTAAAIAMIPHVGVPDKQYDSARSEVADVTQAECVQLLATQDAVALTTHVESMEAAVLDSAAAELDQFGSSGDVQTPSVEQSNTFWMGNDDEYVMPMEAIDQVEGAWA
jgi:hypothetical protein